MSLVVPIVAPAQDGIPWLDPQPGGVGALVCWRESDGAQRLASAGADRTVRIWDLRTGTPLGAPLIGHTACVGALTCWTDAAGSVRLASSGEDHTIWIWDVAQGTAVAGPLTGHTEWVMGLTSWIGPDGSARLASASADRTVRIWAASGELLDVLRPAASGGLWAVAALTLPDGTVRLAAGGDGGEILLWDAQTAEHVGSISGACPAGVYSMAALRDSAGRPLLAVGGVDGTVRLWDADGRAVTEPMPGHTAAVRGITAWSEPGGDHLLATAAADGTIRIWDVGTGALRRGPFTGHLGWMPAVTAWFDPAGAPRLASAGDGGTIRVWDPESGTDLMPPLIGHVAGQWALTSWTGAGGLMRLASAGDDAVIRIWDPESGTPAGPPLAGHTAGIWALTSWTRSDGRSRLASAGDDGTVRVWDPDAGTALLEPLSAKAAWVPALVSWPGPAGDWRLASGGTDGVVRIWDPETGSLVREWESGAPWVLALEAWAGPDGASRLATAGDDGQVRVWDPETGAAVCEPMAGHTAWARALAVWRRPDGTPALASAGFDATVRTWDPEGGVPIGGALTGHSARIGALTAWLGQDGEQYLASGSDDDSIGLWDPRAGAAFGEPLLGHTSGVWALTSWVTTAGDARIASAGYDGTVRLWNPWTGEAVRTIETGPITLWGMSDAPAKTDLLGRGALAEAVAHQAFRRVADGDGEVGPTVISVEGPWGSGKSTLMTLVRELAPGPRLPAPPVPADPLTPRQALRLIRDDRRPERTLGPDPEQPGVVTAWFNPWFYQSGQQVWAGLAGEIIEAVAPVLYPGESERERYWLGRNLDRVDRFALRSLLLRRVVSPLLGAGFVTLLLPFLLGLAALDRPLKIYGDTWTAVSLAAVVALLFVFAVLAHSLYRYWFGRASHYIPGAMLRLPILDGSDPTDTANRSDRALDPLRSAAAGSLYLLQHDIGALIADLAATGNELVVFIDDLDRCRSDTAAEVFEAVNLFLSGVAAGHGLRARFVIGLDPAVVASHLDAYTGAPVADSVVFAQDPSPGWAFLRKLVQLPVLLPQISDAGVTGFVEAVTRRPAARPAAVSAPSTAGVPAARVAPPSAPVPTPGTSEASRAASAVRVSTPARRPARTSVLAVRTLEQHPRIQQLLKERIATMEEPSIREAKRMLNVWQLYERALMVDEPLARSDEAVDRACLLVYVAEIVVRWPALQRRLHRRVDDGRGLGLLAAASGDDELWAAAVARLEFDPVRSGPALNGLRRLLREHDGPAIARLAGRVL